MQKVISINLNGHAYQLEEGGYDTLRAYLARAESDLAANPDRVEIMADLEQAIADRCQAVLFVLTALTTKGVGVMAYVIMMFVVPEANTPDERAAASGGPFNAKDVVDRAAKQASEGARRMRKTWLHQEQRWRRHTRPFAHAAMRTGVPSAVNGALAAIFTGVHFVVFFALVAAIVSLVNHEAVLGWDLDPDVPVWAAVLILLVLYQIAITPLRAAAGAPWAANGGWGDFWSATVWLVGLAFALWIGSENLPELREFMQRVPDVLRDFRDTVRDATRG